MRCSDAVATCTADPAISNAPITVKAAFRILVSFGGRSGVATASRAVSQISRQITSEDAVARYAEVPALHILVWSLHSGRDEQTPVGIKGFWREQWSTHLRF